MIRLLLFLIISVMMVGGTSMAENLSTCSVDTVPIQILTKRGDRPKTTLSAVRFTSGNPIYNTFITTVTEHLSAKLAQEKLCLHSAESKERSLIQFAQLYVGVSEDDHALSALRPLEAEPSDVCRISSPWIDIAIEREPVPSVRAIVRFSDRQLLADQAALWGANDVPGGVAVPLTPDEYGHYIFEYVRSEIPPRPMVKPIEERVPPDLLWLFRRASQSTRSPFGGRAGRSMIKAMEAGAEGYTKIVITLIDQCFASEEADIQYNSVLDIADLIQLEQYKIVTPIR